MNQINQATLADRGPQALQPLPIVPATPPAPMVQLPAQQDQLVTPTQPGWQAQGVLNWSEFRPEFSCKPGEDAEVHLLRTNGWMETHNFPEAMKVQKILPNFNRRSKVMV